MDIRKIKKLIELVEESGIMELEISEGKNLFALIAVHRQPAPYNTACRLHRLHRSRQPLRRLLLRHLQRQRLRQVMS